MDGAGHWRALWGQRVRDHHRAQNGTKQPYALYPHMSVAENVGFALRLAGVKADEVARRVLKAAEMMGIGISKRPG